MFPSSLTYFCFLSFCFSVFLLPVFLPVCLSVWLTVHLAAKGNREEGIVEEKIEKDAKVRGEKNLARSGFFFLLLLLLMSGK